MACASDFFIDLPEYRLIICKVCSYAVWPDQVRTHLKGRPHCMPPSTTKAIANELKIRNDLVLSTDELFELPLSVDEAISVLPLYQDGLQCTLDLGRCGYICRSRDTLRSHWRDVYGWSVAEGRRGANGTRGQREIAQRYAEAVAHVHCQRFFVSRKHARYFEVLSSNAEQLNKGEVTVKGLTSEVLEELSVLEEEQQKRRQIVSDVASSKQVSLWLELTRWPSYLDGHKLSDVAFLAALPRPNLEPVLTIVCQSVDRLVEEAYQSICNDRVNVFDQSRINSFLQRPRAADKLLMVKLQKTTYRAYKSVLKRLLSFAYRSVQP